MKQKRWQYENEEIYWEDILLSLNAWLGFAGKQENRQFINQVLFSLPFQHPETEKDFKFWIPDFDL